MAALLFCVCGALHDLCDFAGAFVRCDCDYQRTIKYLNYKKRILLFRQYCREFHVNYQKCQKIPIADAVSPETAVTSAFVTNSAKSFQVENKKATKVDQVDNRTFAKPKVIMCSRSGVDFAAIEASAEAFEVIDSFGIKSGTSSEDFIEVEKQYSGFQENYFNEDEIEVIDGVEELTIYQDDNDEPIYHNPSLGKLREGISFTVNGKTMRHCERFSINFIVENPSRDIALHINPRLPQNYIVRNSKVRDAWGQEEVASALPFSLRRGARFSIQILFTDECYMISVNGQHFCKFFHRLPYKSVETLEVKGEIQEVTVERQKVEYYPERSAESEPKQVDLEKVLRSDTTDISEDDESVMIAQSSETDSHWLIGNSSSVLRHKESCSLKELKLPYYGTIRNNLFQLNRVLKIEGRVRLLPQSFYINLQSGNNFWPHPVVALHLNPRFTKQHSGHIGRATVIRNSWLNGTWGQEERSELETAFRPGQFFSLSIVHTDESFEIYVNHLLLTEYKFRVSPSTIDTVYIQGDIKLFNVELQERASFERLKQIKAQCTVNI